MRCIQVTGSDNRMDCRDMFYDPLNSLPEACGDCGFPELSHVPEPYFLVRSRTMNPNELAPAEMGNLLVRERLRTVFELVAPGDFAFYPTTFLKSSEQTPWWLAVPKHQVAIAEVDPKIPRCKTCGEPRAAHPGTQYSKWIWDGQSDHDALKSSTWASSESGWLERWIDRDIYLSVRLLSLLKQIGAKGLDPTEKPPPLEEDEEAWVQVQLQLLDENGVPSHAPGTVSNEDLKWYRRYLRENALAEKRSHDWKSIEKRLGFKLPKSYRDFLDKVGSRSFDDLDGQPGFTARILSPEDLDENPLSASEADEEDAGIHAIVFATTDHGDCFCFDARRDLKEFEVLLYLHEMESFEAYASNFAACIRRFAGG